MREKPIEIKAENKDPIITTKITKEINISSIVIGHILVYGASLNDVTGIEIIQRMSSEHRRNDIKLTKYGQDILN